MIVSSERHSHRCGWPCSSMVAQPGQSGLGLGQRPLGSARPWAPAALSPVGAMGTENQTDSPWVLGAGRGEKPIWRPTDATSRRQLSKGRAWGQEGGPDAGQCTAPPTVLWGGRGAGLKVSGQGAARAL